MQLQKAIVSNTEKLQSNVNRYISTYKLLELFCSDINYMLSYIFLIQLFRLARGKYLKLINGNNWVRTDLM